MPKRSRTTPLRRSETRPKKQPVRLVTKAHQLEREEDKAAAHAVRRGPARSEEADGKNPMAVALGRLGGLKGGKARAENMTASERRKSALIAARARWDKR